ncbi:MAG: rRNA maturation RNase YbeY [Crocinitomicaceae bacterium]
MVEFIFQSKPPEDFSENSFHLLVSNLIESEGFTEGDLIYVFMSDEQLLEYNKELLGHDYFTDIITIDQKIGDIISGEFLVSIDRIKENSQDLGEIYLFEFYRVLVHGVLHIIGYNDKTEEEKLVMRERENFYLSLLTF